MLGISPDNRRDPLPALLLVLTAVTGLVDAVSYLQLGQVFVANMTGNVVLLGFAVAGADPFSIPASLAAIGAFMAGAVIGGRMGSSAGDRAPRLLTMAMSVQIGLIAAALVVSMAGGGMAKYPLIVLLALAMGLQNAVARRLGLADLTTTVLTLTLTGLAADSSLAGGNNARFDRRLLAVGAMLLGAAIGALLVLHAGISAALALALALLVLNGIASFRLRRLAATP